MNLRRKLERLELSVGAVDCPACPRVPVLRFILPGEQEQPPTPCGVCGRVPQVILYRISIAGPADFERARRAQMGTRTSALSGLGPVENHVTACGMEGGR